MRSLDTLMLLCLALVCKINCSAYYWENSGGGFNYRQTEISILPWMNYNPVSSETPEANANHQHWPGTRTSRRCFISRPPVRTPVFHDGENLSQEGCGVWKDEFSESPPWAVSIVDDDGQSVCVGTLIARSIILSEGCEEEFQKFNNNSSGYHACVGECYQKREKTYYLKYQTGYLDITNAVSLRPGSFRRPLHLWYFEKDENEDLTPICLFNRDSSRDLDTSMIFWTSFLPKISEPRQTHNFQIVDTKECLNESIECGEFDKSICVYTTADCKRDGLLYNYFGKRYYLRGINQYSQCDGTPHYILYFDLLYIIRDIVLNSGKALYIMPDVPPVKERIVFTGPLGLSYPDCGRRLQKYDPEFAPFSTKGQPLEKEEAPWHATISKLQGKDYMICCGGSLITPQVVLTAAHCVAKQENIIVSVGLINRLQFNDSLVQTQDPASILVHPMYNSPSGKYENDVALIFFRSPFHVGSYVRPVCLWSEDYHLGTIVNKKGLLSGYGHDENKNLPEMLQGVELPVRSYWDCYLTNKNFFSSNMLPGITFCAGMDGKSACRGDSGGGFVMTREGRWFIRGIVSIGVTKKGKSDNTGDTTCDPRYPSLYTDVASYMDWIVRNVPNLNAVEKLENQEHHGYY